jgi:hypothetical protein
MTVNMFDCQDVDIEQLKIKYPSFLPLGSMEPWEVAGIACFGIGYITLADAMDPVQLMQECGESVFSYVSHHAKYQKDYPCYSFMETDSFEALAFRLVSQAIEIWCTQALPDIREAIERHNADYAE